MHSYLRLYLTRDDYYRHFSTQIKQQAFKLTQGRNAIHLKDAKKAVKKRAWRVVKSLGA